MAEGERCSYSLKECDDQNCQTTKEGSVVGSVSYRGQWTYRGRGSYRGTSYKGERSHTRGGRRSGRPRQLTCYSCGQVGHIMKYCTSKEKVTTTQSLSADTQSPNATSLKHLTTDDITTTNNDITTTSDDITTTKSDITPANNDITPAMTNNDITTTSDDITTDSPFQLFDDDLFDTKNDTIMTSFTYHKRKSLYEHFNTYPNYLDTHCHLEYLLEKHRLTSFTALATKFSYPSNFDGSITSFCDPLSYSSFSCANELLQEEKVWASFGIHPHHSYAFNKRLEDKLVERLTHPKCVALGEIGLDYSSHSLRMSSVGQQKRVFRQMLSLSQSFNKPLVVHCREAENDMYDILTECLPSDWYIHLHCYTGSFEMANKFIKTFPNLYLGFTGHVTLYKFKESRQIVQEIPLNRILLETDSPYMVPYSMKRHCRVSHPPMSACVGEEISKLRNNCTVEEVLKITRENAKTIYGI